MCLYNHLSVNPTIDFKIKSILNSFDTNYLFSGYKDNIYYCHNIKITQSYKDPQIIVSIFIGDMGIKKPLICSNL